MSVLISKNWIIYILQKKLYLESLEETENLLLLFYKKNEINLIKFGLKKFYKFFYKNTSDLLKNNQKDTVDERGQPFWRGNKIMQHHIDFKEQDELSWKFIFYLSLIINRILWINISINEKDVLINSCVLYNEIESLKNDKIELISKAKQNERINWKKADIIKLLEECQFKNNIFISEKFDKDNDELFHVDFVNCFSNLRVRNYSIGECDKEKTRKIAGNIVPAIISTIACTAGFVAFQIYSVHIYLMILN